MPLPPVPTERDNMAMRYRQVRDVKAWAARAVWLIQAKEAIRPPQGAEDPSDFFLRLVS
jgi:hypothetical protein